MTGAKLLFFILALGLLAQRAQVELYEKLAETRYVGRVGVSGNHRNVFLKGSSASLKQPRPRTIPGYVRSPKICKGKCDNRVFSEVTTPKLTPLALNVFKSASGWLAQTAATVFNLSPSPNIPFVDMPVAEVPQFSAPQLGGAPKPMEPLSNFGSGGAGSSSSGPSGQGGGARGGGGSAAGAGSGSPGETGSEVPSSLSEPLHQTASRSPKSFGDTSSSPALASVGPSFSGTPQAISNSPGMKGDISPSPQQDYRPYLPEQSTPSSTSSKWNLAFRRKEGQDVVENLCGGSPVGKRKDDEQGTSCTFAFYTAAHCVERDFYQMRLQRFGDGSYQQIAGNSVKVERAEAGNDVALLYFAAGCDFVPDKEMGHLADVNPDGTTKFDHSQPLSTITQEGGTITGTINSGVQHEGNSNLIADINSGPESRKGDSGSSIIDNRGFIVGALSGGSIGRRDFSFSPTGNRWALERLALNGFFKPVNENPYPSLAGQSPGSQPLEIPKGQRPSQIPSGTPIHEGFSPALNGRFEDRLIGALPKELHGAGQVCVNCHNQPANREQVPAGVRSLDSLGTHLAAMNDSVLDTMLKRSHLSPHDEDAMRAFVKKARAMVQTTANRGFSSRIAACYMSLEEQTRKTNEVPTLRPDSMLAAKLADAQNNGRMMFYDKGSVPRAWQSSKITERDGTVTRLQNILTERNTPNPHMYGEMGYHSDGAREHPWAHSAGMDISPNGSADKFVIPPTDGPMMRLVSRSKQTHPHYFGPSANVNGPQIGYEYAPGTMFGEVLKVSGVPFEIRLRLKNAAGDWVMDVLRPFQNMAEFAERLVDLCKASDKPAGCAQAEGKLAGLANLGSHTTSRSSFINAATFGTKRDPLSLNSPAADATVKNADMQWIPDLPADLIRAALTKTPFKPVFNTVFTEGANPSSAATTDSNFSIFPKHFFGGLIPLNKPSCTKCHDSAGRHVDQFDPSRNQMYAPAPNDAPRPRTWYNNIPGDDNILSFHPWSKQAVESGALTNYKALNECLVKNGLVQ